MGNRVLLGNRSTGGYGLYVSKDGSDVTSCAKKDLLLNDSADNFLTTGSKASLGYIPLVISVEKNMGARFDGDGSEYEDIDEISIWKTTTSTYTPCTANTLGSGGNGYIGPEDGRGYANFSNSEENAINVSYFVLRIPCAYGYMTSTYFG